MESISYYGGSDEEQENASNSKPRDNSSSHKYGSHGHGSASTDTVANARRRHKTDDTNYEEIQMDLSEDSDSSEDDSPPAKSGNCKPKKCEANPTMAQSSHRSDKPHRSNDKQPSSSFAEQDRRHGDRGGRGSASGDRMPDKTRDKADRYKKKDRSRGEKDHERHSRERGRNSSRSDKDDKYSRHRDNRSDNRRDRSDRSDHKRSDKERHDRDRRDRHSTRSRSRSREHSNVAAAVPARSHPHDLHNRKEPPKSLMSLQLPQMPLSATSATKPIVQPIATGTAAPPSLISPLLASARYTDQMQKRKLLWGNKKVDGEQQQTTNNRWEQAKFSQDSDGKMASKFLRLMGMKDGAAKAVVEDEQTAGGKGAAAASSAPDSIKKQNEMLSSMEQQYEVARQMTHTMRGMGLGFGTQPRNY